MRDRYDPTDAQMDLHANQTRRRLRGFALPSMTPLAKSVDTVSQDVLALDLTIDAMADDLTGDEVVEFASIVAMLLTCTEALRECVEARERRLLGAVCEGRR